VVLITLSWKRNTISEKLIHNAQDQLLIKPTVHQATPLLLQAHSQTDYVYQPAKMLE